MNIIVNKPLTRKTSVNKRRRIYKRRLVIVSFIISEEVVMVPWFPWFLEFVPSYLEMVTGYLEMVPGYPGVVTGYIIGVPGYLSLSLVT